MELVPEATPVNQKTCPDLYAKSCPRSTPDLYKYHKSTKKLKYEQRIVEVEKAVCPLMFSCTEGAGPPASEVITERGFQDQRLEKRFIFGRDHVHKDKNKFSALA